MLLNAAPLKDLLLGAGMGPSQLSPSAAPVLTQGQGTLQHLCAQASSSPFKKRAVNESSLTHVSGIHLASPSPAHLFPNGK